MSDVDDTAGRAATVIFLFETTHTAMQAEEEIINSGFWCEVVPRPPEVTETLCGLAIEVRGVDRAPVEEALAAAGVDFELYHPSSNEH